MNQKDRIQIEFGMPEHGWLQMNFKYHDFELELDISDVPLDPMVQLCDTLIQITKGINKPDRVIWHLEPYCYYLQLERSQNDFKATILESDELDSPTKVTKEILGGFEEIILPLFRELKRFWSKSYKHPHWDELETARIEELTNLIKVKRT